MHSPSRQTLAAARVYPMPLELEDLTAGAGQDDVDFAVDIEDF